VPLKRYYLSSYKMNNQQQVTHLFCVFLTVVLFYFAFPSGGVGVLAWIAIVPTLAALYKTQGRYAFTLVLLAATLGWFCSIWWVIAGIAYITSSPPNLILPFVFIFCVVCALPYAIGAWFYVTLHWYKSILGALKAACLFTVLVNFIPHILPGNIVHSLYLSPYFIQLADIGGVALIFFVIHAVSFLLAAGVNEVTRNKTKALQYFTCAALLFLGNLLYGYSKSAYIEEELIEHNTETFSVAMIQPNIDVSLRTREDWLGVLPSVNHLFSQYFINKATKTTINQVRSQDNTLNVPDLIVFPEVPVPISYEFYHNDKLFFSEVVGDIPLLLTAIEPINHELTAKEGYYNTIELISNNHVIERYQKQKLLPMGEFLPFEEQLPWLRNLLPYAPNYKAGSGAAVLPLLLPSQTVQLIPLICYEAVFTDLVAEGVGLGGDIMINTVNDAWFAHTAGVKVHLALSLFRTIEYRKPLVRATNTGISSVINAKGEIIEESLITSDQQGVSITQIPLANIETFYQKHPNFIAIIFIIVTLLSLIIDWKKVKINNEY